METFLVISYETDGEPVINRLTIDQIKVWAKNNPHDSFCVIDGEVVKGFSKKLDVGRLKCRKLS